MGSCERLARFTIERRVNHIVCCAYLQFYLCKCAGSSRSLVHSYNIANNRTAESLLVCTTVESVGTTVEGTSSATEGVRLYCGGSVK